MEFLNFSSGEIGFHRSRQDRHAKCNACNVVQCFQLLEVALSRVPSVDMNIFSLTISISSPEQPRNGG